jgi:NTP pyrophosphatase (non-canonical NTP hydrolase)
MSIGSSLVVLGEKLDQKPINVNNYLQRRRFFLKRRTLLDKVAGPRIGARAGPRERIRSEDHMGMTVKELQDFIVKSRAQMEIGGRVFGDEPPEVLALGLASEVGEAIGEVEKEYVYHRARKPDTDGSSLGNEMADVAIYFLALAHKCGVDVEERVMEKMKINLERYRRKSK